MVRQSRGHAVRRQPGARHGEVPSTLRAFLISLAVHVVGLLLLLLAGWLFQPSPPQRPMSVIDATLVDISSIGRAEESENEQATAEEQAQQQAREQQQEQERQAQREREQQAQREAEQQAERERQAEQREREQQQQAERERQEREAQQQREREQAAERRRQEQEALEREREQQRQELEAMRQRREEAARQREQAERELAEAQAQREADRQREAERQRQEAEQAAAARAEAQAARASLRDQYVAAIAALVQGNWRRPPTAQPGLRCTVRVFQIPGGEVIDAEIIGQCNADAATQSSIVNAVMRSDPLPYRGYEDVFAREIDFVFRYDG